jgi:regulator of sigma E protease
MDLLYTILVTLATLAVLVAVHEYGHFWVARRCGVKVLRFSIGFGRVLLRWPRPPWHGIRRVPRFPSGAT